MIALNAAAETSHHLEPLISDLGLILMTAGIAVLLFKKMKQPLVLGYLIAGFLAGNHFDFFPSVTDMKSVEVWAEIGVIFLLFSLGLEFSFKKLMKVGGTSSITAITQILFMVVIGYFIGQWMGWGKMDSIFLGATLSISSTTIIIRAFDELGVKGKKFVGIVFGALIVEDIVAILMMVLLATVAVSDQVSGAALLQSVLKLVFFLIIWFLGGIFIIPTILKKAKHLLTDEMLLIISLALCLMMVMFAANVGFSPALGAFIMGSIIAETTQAEKIEHLIQPVKDLFGAVFFVSVGMLINPETLVTYALPVAIITLVTIFGKAFSSATGALLSGQPLRQSVQTGMSLAQIGEFSFIIATLGMSLKVTSDFLYPIIVAVSAITTFTTPFLIKYSDPFSQYLEEKLPKKWVKNINRYSLNAQAIKSVSTWQKVLNTYIIQIVLNTIIIAAIILLSSKFVAPLVADTRFGNTLAALITLVIIAPFLWALSLRRVAVEEVELLWEERKYRGALLMMILIRMSLGLFFIGFLLNIFFSPLVAFVALIIAIVAYQIFPKKLNEQYHKIENHFLKNFNDRENKKIDRRYANLMPWDGHMSIFEIGKESNLAGKTLQELRIREQLGINIAYIRRGEVTIPIPTKTERLFPGDEICVIGTDAQVTEFTKYLNQNETETAKSVEESQIVLRQLEVADEEFIQKSIGQFRTKTNGMVVGIERNGNRILNPESHLVLEQNDIIWVVGDKKRMNELMKKA
ncbi:MULTISPECIES: cation:proton antiporter domain-containing protein [Flavobacterium]|uniref:Sodium:proton antiporter n=1 Tax=Flavobacterium pectinovorum TaxID=29533 RepID=A0AB36NVS1_9FLAO|nr:MULTISPECIES: cation:proton antiporter [Flavobacterium]KIQ20915.1 sodium:proton antiporter [Flavobacterium sp. MEB061]OXB00065.1 sodium:proton antiporter [Flavobacterium pectinovorum]SHM54172.1 transporter, CPA2 family [Flavobacterium pectinovorum]